MATDSGLSSKGITTNKGYAFEYETAGAVKQRANALKRALNNAQEDKGYINTNES
jgi:hypothetical protein